MKPGSRRACRPRCRRRPPPTPSAILLFFTRERRIRECPRHRCQCRLGPTIAINQAEGPVVHVMTATPPLIRPREGNRATQALAERSTKVHGGDTGLAFKPFADAVRARLDTECFDVTSFNVYLHRESDLRAYLARLQQVAGSKPLLLAEAGADSIREGLEGQARITAMHIRAAFNEGLCGAVAFSWTDEWWRGGHDVDDWAFGLVDRERQPKPALAAVARRSPMRRSRREEQRRRGRRCRWWSAPTTRPTRSTTAGVAAAARLPELRSHPRQRRLARSDR